MHWKWVVVLALMSSLILCVNAYTEEPEQIIWQREISLGYNRSSGNTETSQLTANLFINRKKERINEATLKADTYYSSSNKKMDAQKWYGMGRYAFGFGRAKNWYNFYRLEGDHDRFGNIDYRLVPAIGFGYWFYDLPETKLMAEVGIGLERTNYRDKTEDSNEGVLVPRAFFEKELFGGSKISQDLYAYPVFEDFSDYRLRSETVFTRPITEKLSLRLSVIDDYNSKPPASTKKNDMQFISSLKYSF